MIYSATYGGDNRIFTSHLSKICLGLSIMLAMSLVDLNFIKKHAYLFYLIGIILLICATFFGIVGKGSRRWLNIGGLVFQPSELIKILVIITLAKFFDEKLIFVNVPWRHGLFVIHECSEVIYTLKWQRCD